jgi:plasmid stabilization system protein ParE
MAFRVSLSPSAIADAESAYLWYKEQNQQFADAWFNDLAQAITSLENFPTRCPVAPESKDLEREIRQLLYQKSKSSCLDTRSLNQRL